MLIMKQVNWNIPQRFCANLELQLEQYLVYLAIWFIYSKIFYTGQVVFIILGIFLILFGALFPKFLKSVYRYWMTAAFVLGWFVSRFLLTILFFMVLTPIALIAKLFKKEFLNLNYKQNQQSYWIKKTTSKINYEKMY